MSDFFLMMWGFISGSTFGSILFILFFREEILNKRKVKSLEKRLENAKVYLQEYFALNNRLEPIEEYLQKKHGLTFDKIEKLILQESYKENNVININNFRKFKK